MAKSILVSFLLFLSVPSFAQQVKVNGYFLKDSAMLGERVGYVLKAEYPEDYQMLFPDSSYVYGDQVLLEKQTFVTSTNEGTTLDSAVYFMSNFSLDPSIYVALPVYEILPYDSIPHFPLEAELKLKLTLDSIPEELQFKENNVYQPLEKETNWVMIGLWSGLGIFLLILGYIFFAKPIKRFLHQRSEKSRWKRFERMWEIQTERLSKEPSIDLADEIVGQWKAYMEHLTALPYQEWTSSEISETLDDEKVFEALRAIDVIIYAGHSAESKEATEYLLSVTRQAFEEKVNRIKNDSADK